MAVLDVRPTLNSQQRQPASGVSRPAGSWLHVLPHLDPVYGGLSAVVPCLAQELARRDGVQVRLASFCLPGEERFASAALSTSFWPLSHAAWFRDRHLRQSFQSEVRGSAGLHIHGLWESSTLIAANAARAAGVPYVLSAHGMLEHWALRNKRLKKLVYSALFEHRNVRGAACLHALTDAEAEDYRRFGCKGPIAIIPNGVQASPNADATAFLSAYPRAVGSRVVLFLGRIHYKKGVDLLVKAWAAVTQQFPDALLVMAGPDSEQTLSRVQAEVERLHLEQRVLFTGMLDSAMKWSALAAAHCFVLPSYSEGLSVATLEALSMGVPVILSSACNLPQIEDAGAGWLIKTEPEALAQALQAALQCRQMEWQIRSDHAKQLAERDFSWGSVGDRMAEVYRWVSGGPEPAQVDLLREKI